MGKVLTPGQDLIARVEGPFSTILADPPWRFQNRTGKMAPEHRRLSRINPIRTAQRLGQDVLDSSGFNHSSDAATGNDTGARCRRLEQDIGCPESDRYFMRDGRPG